MLVTGVLVVVFVLLMVILSVLPAEQVVRVWEPSAVCRWLCGALDRSQSNCDVVVRYPLHLQCECNGYLSLVVRVGGDLAANGEGGCAECTGSGTPGRQAAHDAVRSSQHEDDARAGGYTERVHVAAADPECDEGPHGVRAFLRGWAVGVVLARG
jgi:hypothetical protein